jgi:splicing factor 3B subunit 4
MVKLYGKPLRVNKTSQDRATQDVGANLFIGNLDPDVDETLLYTTFSAFGVVVGNPKVMRDPDSGVSKGFGFVSFDDFEASDMAIEAMNGQYLGGRPIAVGYAYKKDTKGERHGTPAERLLAAQRKMQQPQTSRPHTMFASGPKQQPQPGVDLPMPHHGMGMAYPPGGAPFMPPPQHPHMGGGGGYPMQGNGGWGGPPPSGMYGGGYGGPPGYGMPPPPHMQQGYPGQHHGGMMMMPPPPPPPGGYNGGIPPPPPPPPGSGGDGAPPPPPPPPPPAGREESAAPPPPPAAS